MHPVGPPFAERLLFFAAMCIAPRGDLHFFRLFFVVLGGRVPGFLKLGCGPDERQD